MNVALATPLSLVLTERSETGCPPASRTRRTVCEAGLEDEPSVAHRQVARYFDPDTAGRGHRLELARRRAELAGLAGLVTRLDLSVDFDTCQPVRRSEDPRFEESTSASR